MTMIHESKPNGSRMGLWCISGDLNLGKETLCVRDVQVGCSLDGCMIG